MRAGRTAVGGAAALAVALPFLLGASAPPPEGTGTPVLRFGDPDIVESSGLAVTLTTRGGLVHTVNDSGDSGRVFTVDTATGSTVGVTSWETDPDDVEALAPAGRGHVWVGDIGDNWRARDSVEVLHVPVGPGERTVAPRAFELVYPDGPRDAEALLADPLTGRLHVVTKGVLSGTVYAAPLRLRADRPNQLVEVARAPGVVTDATFLPGGGGAVLRTYSTAHLVAYPSWRPVASWDLPAQEQGEGIAYALGQVLVSTEGARSEVLAVDLPPEAGPTDLAGPAWTALRSLAVARGVPL